MWLLLLIGLFCFLLVLAKILKKEPVRFAVSGIVLLAAIAFIVFMIGMISTLIID